jgi:hypothetical protein
MQGSVAPLKFTPQFSEAQRVKQLPVLPAAFVKVYPYLEVVSFQLRFF